MKELPLTVGLLFFRTVFLLAGLAAADPSVVNAKVAVTTYHYDPQRTGWNNNETTLTAANFPSNFGIIATVSLDDQVDAQPLIVPNKTISGGKHDVVYVVTESNPVYAIGASTGAILLSKNLEPPVPMPFQCGNNGPDIGITAPQLSTSADRGYMLSLT